MFPFDDIITIVCAYFMGYTVSVTSEDEVKVERYIKTTVLLTAPWLTCFNVRVRGWPEARKACYRACKEGKKEIEDGRINSLFPRQNAIYFTDNIFKYIFFKENFLILIQFDQSFLAATKQLYEWYFLSVCPSVRPSVCPSHLFDYVPIIVSSWNFQELSPRTRVTSMQTVRGQRSRSQRSRPNLTVSGL